MHVTHAYTYPIHWFSSQQSTLDLENSFIYFRHCRRLTWSMISLNLPTPWRSWIVLKTQMKNYRTILGNGAKSKTEKTKRPIKCWIRSSERYAFNSTICDSTVTSTCFVFVVFQNNLYVILCIFVLSFGWPLSIVVSSTEFCVYCGASKYHRRDSECDALLSHEKTT